jgi:hypothetical protein
MVPDAVLSLPKEMLRYAQHDNRGRKTNCHESCQLTTFCYTVVVGRDEPPGRPKFDRSGAPYRKTR